MIIKIKYIDDNLLKLSDILICRNIETIYELDKFILLVNTDGNHTKYLKDTIEYIEINPILN